MLLERAAQKTLGGIATALSLSQALYKPWPQLPTASEASDSSNGQSTIANTFVTTTSSSSSEAALENPFADTKEYGVVSELYIPKNETTLYSTATSESNGITLTSSSSTVGPGNCPLHTGSYTPVYTLSSSPDYADFDSVKATIMRYRQQVGVNLGAWFVQEGWMESTFLACAQGTAQSEYELLEGFGNSTNGLLSAQYYLEQHWDTWFTEDDFYQMSLIGINTVRLPVGYWSIGPYFCENSTFSSYSSVYTNSYKYIARAINWAAKYDIGVLVDLHGAYGSQNGQAHSGVPGTVGFYTTENMDLTADLLTWLTWELAGVTNVIGIELLNEPENNTKLWPWYNSTMNAMREVNDYAKTLPLYFHDAFVIARGAKLTASRTDFVVEDDHSYFVFTTADDEESADSHTADIESGSVLEEFESATSVGRGNLVVGEYSCALSPESLENSTTPVADEKAFCEAQQAMYLNNTGGQIYWSYNMQSCSSNQGWCLKSALGYYLPKVLGAWGWSGLIQNRKILLNLTSSIDTSHAIVSEIATLTNSVNGASAKSVGLSTRDVSFDVYSEGEALLGRHTTSLLKSGYDVAPLLSLKYDPANTSTRAKRSLIDDTNGVGSPAARARSLVRPESRDEALRARSTTQVTLAKEAGYSDGFLTVTYLAASMNSTTPLSRLGFRTQYIMDSWAKRVSDNSTAYTTSNYDTYETYFLSGLNDAEDTIRYIVNNADILS